MPIVKSRRSCVGPPNISKTTVIASFDEGSPTRNYLESLDNDQWVITSFNDLDKSVCFDVVNGANPIVHMSLILPVPR